MRILVPLDNSDPARKALEHAITHYSDTEITVLHVINPMVSLYGGDTDYNYRRMVEEGEKKANELFANVTSEINIDQVSIETDTVVGQTARSIVEYADQHEFDQIILGSHGRSGASRVLLGSVAETVVRRSAVPVTVVR
jgi:nucleotide-binding universal stress UspA family protein